MQTVALSAESCFLPPTLSQFQRQTCSTGTAFKNAEDLTSGETKSITGQFIQNP